MEFALFVARLLLMLVFLAAGITKVVDLTGSRSSLLGFGVPPLLVPIVNLLLPLLEIAVAISLLTSVGAWWGAVVALALLLVFVLGISVNLARGQTPPCHCFGQFFFKPIGWSTLVRSGWLAAIAALLVAEGPRLAAPASLDRIFVEKTRLVSEGILFGLAAVGGWVILQRRRNNEPVTTSGMPIGGPAPNFRLHDLSGNSFTLDSLCAHNLPVMLIFWDPLCGPCSSLLAEISRWQQDYASKLNIVIISRGEEKTNRAKTAKWGVRCVLLQTDHEVSRAYRVRRIPAAIIVRPYSRTASPTVVGVQAIRALVEQFVNNVTVITR